LFVRRPQLSECVFDKTLQAGIEMAFEFVGMRWDDPFRLLLVGARWDGLRLPLRPVAAIIAQPSAFIGRLVVKWMLVTISEISVHQVVITACHSFCGWKNDRTTY
jgi:hypothetical protein